MSRAGGRGRPVGPVELPEGEPYGGADPEVIEAAAKYADMLHRAGRTRDAIEISGAVDRVRGGRSPTDAAMLEARFASATQGGMREWLLQAGAAEVEIAAVWRKARAHQWHAHASAFEKACRVAKELAEVAAANDDMEEIQRLLDLLRGVQGGSYSALLEFLEETDVTELVDP